MIEYSMKRKEKVVLIQCIEEKEVLQDEERKNPRYLLTYDLKKTQWSIWIMLDEK